MYQKTYYEISSDLIEKHIIKRVNRQKDIIPDSWELNEEDFNIFIEKYERFDVGEIDVEFEEFEEMDDDDEYSIYEKFYLFLYGKGSQDEKTNTYLNKKREIDRKGMEEWNKKVKQYKEVQ
jgi:hypothetical protein